MPELTYALNITTNSVEKAEEALARLRAELGKIPDTAKEIKISLVDAKGQDVSGTLNDLQKVLEAAKGVEGPRTVRVEVAGDKDAARALRDLQRATEDVAEAEGARESRRRTAPAGRATAPRAADDDAKLAEQAANIMASDEEVKQRIQGMLDRGEGDAAAAALQALADPGSAEPKGRPFSATVNAPTREELEALRGPLLTAMGAPGSDVQVQYAEAGKKFGMKLSGKEPVSELVDSVLESMEEIGGEAETGKLRISGRVPEGGSARDLADVLNAMGVSHAEEAAGAKARAAWARADVAAEKREYAAERPDLDQAREIRARDLAAATEWAQVRYPEASPEEQSEIGRKMVETRYARERDAETSRQAALLGKALDDAQDPVERFSERMRRSSEAFGAGAWRRGGGEFFTGVFERMGVPGSAFAGGFLGSVVSSLVLPFAWALGDVVMNLPQTAGEDVVMRRERNRLLAMGGENSDLRDFLMGMAKSIPGPHQYTSIPLIERIEQRSQNRGLQDAWEDSLASLEGLFSRLQTTSGEPLRDEQARMLRIYQSTGAYDPNQAMEAGRASQWNTMLSILSSVDPRIEQERLSLVESGKLMEYGTSQQRIQAQQQVAQNPEIRRILMERTKEKFGLEGPMGQRVAEAALDRMLKEDPATGLGLDPGDVSRAAFDYAAKDPRINRMWEEQITKEGGEWRMFGTRGFKRWALPYAGELGKDDTRYLERAADIERAAMLAEREGKETFAHPRYFGQTTREEAMEGLRGERGLFGRLPSEPGRREELETLARGWVQGPQAWQGLGLMPEGFDQKEIGGFLPARFQKTSFAGLAEAMQMGWSGAPPIRVGFPDADPDAPPGGLLDLMRGAGPIPAGEEDVAGGRFGAARNASAWGIASLFGLMGAGGMLFGRGGGGAGDGPEIPALSPAADNLNKAAEALQDAAKALQQQGQAETETIPTNLIFAPN
ncbi:MAG: hypothetical protein ACYSVY_18230 [Planctomycetota bacterium]|jgi:hypothetical protein